MLNYKHLHYFWVVARAGGVMRASERLHVTAQTVSGQISVLEEALGCKLFTRVGRRQELSDAGRLVLRYADEIFTLGGELEVDLRQRPDARRLPFRVGIADAVPKALAYRLLEPALRMGEPLRMICREGKLAGLLADLAVQRSDIVLADSPMPSNVNVRGYSHLLGECGLTFFATAALARAHKGAFPRCLDGAPLLLQGEETAVRPRLMRWLDREKLHPRIVGEFDDGALLMAFGQDSAGIFAAPTAIAALVKAQYGVVAIGSTDAVTEQYYAISVERRLTHPAVVAISSGAREDLFRRRPRRA